MKNLEVFDAKPSSSADLKQDVANKLLADANSPGDTTIVRNQINITVNPAFEHSHSSASHRRQAAPHARASETHHAKESEGSKLQGPKAVTAPHSECKESDFGPRQQTAPGDRTVTLNNFNPQKADDHLVFNPVRPPGLAQFAPGEATTDGARRGLDFRVSQSKTGADCSQQYKISGELNDGGMLQLKFDTPFSAEEKFSKNGRLSESSVNYGQPINIDFLSVRGERVAERNVTMVQTKEDAKGIYHTRVVHSSGYETVYDVSPKGEVISRQVKD